MYCARGKIYKVHKSQGEGERAIEEDVVDGYLSGGRLVRILLRVFRLGGGLSAARVRVHEEHRG